MPENLLALVEATNRRSTLVDYTDLRPVRQLAVEAPFVTENKLRWWIFHAQTNGMQAALIKIGGRVYIDKTQFNKWLESQRMAAADTDAA